jgi:hypothetical protein
VDAPTTFFLRFFGAAARARFESAEELESATALAADAPLSRAEAVVAIAEAVVAAAEAEAAAEEEEVAEAAATSRGEAVLGPGLVVVVGAAGARSSRCGALRTARGTPNV